MTLILHDPFVRSGIPSNVNSFEKYNLVYNLESL